MADMIVLGGCVGVEQAAKIQGHVPPAPGRMDALEETMWTLLLCLNRLQTDLETIKRLQTIVRPEELLVDKAQLLTLTPRDDGSRWWHACPEC